MAKLEAGRQPTTYWNYLNLEELLSLQGGVSGDEKDLTPDEVVFIVVHQVYELWMKLMLRDLEAARDLFAQDPVPDDAMGEASRKLARVRTLLELAAEHFRVVETITPRDFLNFRDNLFPASGGQSMQFRELEILLGLEEEERIPYVGQGSYRDVLREPDGSESWVLKRVNARLADRPNLREAIDEWLFRTPIDGSRPDAADDERVVTQFVEDYLEAHGRAIADLMTHIRGFVQTDAEASQLQRRYEKEREAAAAFLRAEDEPGATRPRRRRIRAAALFLEVYRELPLLAWPREIVDGLVSVEQAYVIFRQRHARMVERIIGRRVGTGGSRGVDFLDEGAQKYRVFKDLWAARTLLVRRDLLRGPHRADLYGFQFDGK